MGNRVLTIILFFCITLIASQTNGHCEVFDTQHKVVIVSSNANLKRILKKKNRCFIIRYNHDLHGKIIKVGKNSVLLFDGGGIHDGIIVGKSTSISYNHPFCGNNVTFHGCHIVDKSLIRDLDVFTTVSHTQKEIQSLFDLSDGIPISFSQGEYYDIHKLEINNNIEADFNNSVIHAQVTNKKSSTIFSRGVENRNSPLAFVHIKNLLINGGIDINDIRKKLPENKPSPCIELFSVKDVVLNNVDITQFNPGTEEWKFLTQSYRGKYENYLVALMYGVKAKVSNCDISYCVNEGFKFAPSIDSTNFIEFSNNSSHNRYWTFLEVDDGRCFVTGNLVDGASSSAFNLFCYDSEICNNTFMNSKRGCAIDLTEPADGGGKYRSYNVLIHDNKCYNYPQLLEMWAGKVEVYNNFVYGIIITKNNSAGCIIRMLNKYTEINDRVYKAPFNNPGGQDEYTKDIYIHDNTFDGQFKIGIVLGTRFSINEEGENIVISSNQFLDTKGLNPNYYPVRLFNVKNIVFNNNIIEVLKEGTYHSALDNVYFYCDRCTGTLTAENNKVTKKEEANKRYVFSLASSLFDRAIINDDSEYTFYLHYKSSLPSLIKKQTITTSCLPLPGSKYGKEVIFIKNR